MKVDYQRKATDVQESAKREQEKIFTPFSEKLRKFAAEFTAKREIVILVDLGNAGGALLWYDPRADVTKDFVAEYNKANPVSSPAQK
jgi:hypothetical protein